MNHQNNCAQNLITNLYHVISKPSHKESLSQLLAYIGETYHCERVYIVERNTVGNYDCTYEWFSSQKTYAKKDFLQNLTWERVHYYYKYFLREKDIICEDIVNLKNSDLELYDELQQTSLQSFLVGQLRFENEDVGFIGIDNPQMEQFDELHQMFKSLKMFTAILLQTNRLSSRLELLDRQDSLTGVGTKNALIERAANYEVGKKLTLIYTDFLTLQEINEKDGHQIVDASLLQFAKIMCDIFGESNIYRLHGGDFVAFLEEQSEAHLSQMLMELQTNTEKNEIDVCFGQMTAYAYGANFQDLLLQAEQKKNESKRKYYLSKFGKRNTSHDFVKNDLLEIRPKDNYYRVIFSDHIDKVLDVGAEGNFYEKIHEIASERIHPNDYDEFIRFWNVSNLLSEFSQNDQKRIGPKLFKVKNHLGEWIQSESTVLLFHNANKEPILTALNTTVPNGVMIQNVQRKSTQNVPLAAKDFFAYINHIFQKQKPTYVITLAIDINNFKLYNDIYGRDAGDEYLSFFHEFLIDIARKYNGYASYFGGDNFCLVIPRETLDVGNLKILVDQHFKEVQYRDGFLPAIGVREIAYDRDDISLLYDQASIALNKIRGDIHRHISYYDASAYQEEKRKQLLLFSAPQSLKNGEFLFYLQPKMDMRSQEVIGAEALVRWIHNHEIIPPNDFIPNMEHNGYIAAIDCYIWESVCKWLNQLVLRGVQPLPVSVNVSRVDIYFIDIVAYFSDLITRYTLDPSWLEIEITESAFAEDDEVINQVIRELREKGFKILMDDFGSGYSSLRMLEKTEFDVIKFDRGFLSNHVHEQDHDILPIIISMIEQLHKEIICEGVETIEQLEYLVNSGAKYCQGFYFYKPMPVHEFEEKFYNL